MALRYSLMLVLGGALACAQQGAQPIGEVQAADATVRGAVTLGPAGTMVMSGSQITAGANPAVIRLARGGELKVCSGSSVTLTSSANGRETLIGLNSGSIETRYRLGPNADTILTPDFRLSLPGPGDFHFAVGMKGGGDMCVKSLPGNTSAMIVHEVFGEGIHQVRPDEAVRFPRGSVQGAAALPVTEECGCTRALGAEELGFPEQQSQQAAKAIASGEPPPQSAPLTGVTTKPSEVITKVDAPIVFRGEELAKPASMRPPAAAPPPAQPAAAEMHREAPAPAPVAAAEEPAPPKPARKRWFQRLGSALANLFR